MAQKDASQKIFECYNDVFSDIVNVLLFNGRKVLAEEEQAIVKEAIAAQRGEKLLKVLTAARAEIMNDADPEYEADEMEAINELVDDASDAKPTW